MDTKLIALVEAAERGKTCPPIRILTAPALLTGVPCRAADFGERLREAASQDLWDNIRATAGRDAESVFERGLDELRPTWEAMTHASEPEGDRSVVTLAEAQIWPVAGGDGVELPAVRIPLASIAAWWVGSGKRVKAPREFGWWLGVSFPIDRD